MPEITVNYLPLTVRVKYTKGVMVRLKLSLALMWVAAFVSGWKIHFEVVDKLPE